MRERERGLFFLFFYLIFLCFWILILFCFTFSETECVNIAVVACSQDFLLIFGIFILFYLLPLKLINWKIVLHYCNVDYDVES